MGKRGKKTASYTPAPQIDPVAAPRMLAVLKVLTKEWTVTEAAKYLSMSRNRFQTVYHRALAAMLTELGQKPAGRPAKPEEQREIEEENARLRKENERLSGRVETIDRLLGVASDMLKGRITTSGRQAPKKSSSSSTTETGGDEPEEPDGAARRLLEGAREMRRLGLLPTLAAAVTGVSPQTLRRWDRADRSGQPLCLRPGRRRAAALDPIAVARAQECVRQLAGMIGADSLRVTSGLSRRQASAVKAEVLSTMERERKAAADRVTVTAPGIVRGFDQLYAWTAEGWRFVLMSADAAVPYRTSAVVVDCYDETGVLRAVATDIERHGPPLVWRMDRAACHRTAAVTAYLTERGVLVLHGPPHHPQYYGQTERQNRDHRRWLDAQGSLDPGELQPACDRMLAALNAAWPRRALGWRSPAEAWATRPSITDTERARFRQEVYDRLSRIELKIADRDLATRLAIEQALTTHGYLRIERRGSAN